MLAKTAGVKYLVVLVNKMDDATVNWDELRYADLSLFTFSSLVIYFIVIFQVQ